MVAFTVLLALLGLGVVGTTALGFVLGVNIPQVLVDLLLLFIPFVSVFFGFLYFIVTNFWIVLGVVEVVIMGYSMGEREFMTMMHTFVSLNIKALMFFFELFRRLFELVISFIKLIPLSG